MVKERFEILVEELKKDFRGAFDGISALRSEMHEMKNELKGEIKEVNDKLEFVAKELGSKIDNIDRTLQKHVRQPVHIA